MNINQIAPLKDARTKTVATVGPASGSPEKLKELLRAGADVFRINMAHGSRESHEQSVKDIRQASEESGLPAGILVDLAGPKIRLGQLTQNPLILENNQTVRMIRGLEAHADDELTCNYAPLIDEVAVGDDIVLADGISRIKVLEKSDDELLCTVLDGGPLRSRQGVNLPGTKLSVPALGEIDIENGKWAASMGVEFVSLSFVRNAHEVNQLKTLLQSHGSGAMVVSKIEKAEALDRLEEIVMATDAVMVARGDLGVEIPIERTPLAQKRIINLCLKHRKPVIVATQMLESMHTSKQPTRAEVTDVANAILDGADACMLSGETAIGEYPVEAVKMMNRIMTEVEQEFIGLTPKVTAYDPAANDWDQASSVLFGAAHTAKRMDSKLVLLVSHSSTTALHKSKQRDYIPTVCITDSSETYRRMSLFWGVKPVLIETAIQETKLRTFANQWIRDNTQLETGNSFLIVTDTEVLPGVKMLVMACQVQ
ncbi:pyruvate kinase [Mariniblastus sp.]|nr:pyruvate kinase [Mariniblastus sp.]